MGQRGKKKGGFWGGAEDVDGEYVDRWVKGLIDERAGQSLIDDSNEDGG